MNVPGLPVLKVDSNCNETVLYVETYRLATYNACQNAGTRPACDSVEKNEKNVCLDTFVQRCSWGLAICSMQLSYRGAWHRILEATKICVENDSSNGM